MHQFDIKTKLRAEIIEHLDCGVDVEVRLENRRRRSSHRSPLLVLLGGGGAPHTVPGKTRHRSLHAHVPVALRHVFTNLILQVRQFACGRVRVQWHGCANFAAQELVNRHVTTLAKDVPQCPVDTAEGVVSGYPRAEIRLHVSGPPDIFDFVAILSDHERFEVFLQIRGHCEGPLMSWRAHAVEPRSLVSTLTNQVGAGGCVMITFTSVILSGGMLPAGGDWADWSGQACWPSRRRVRTARHF
jgi:hypothetical protein